MCLKHTLLTPLSFAATWSAVGQLRLVIAVNAYCTPRGCELQNL